MSKYKEPIIPAYKTGFINIPVKSASYCDNTNSSTFSMCKFPRRPTLITSWSMICPETQRIVQKALEPI